MRTILGILFVGLVTAPVLWAQQPLAITRVLLYKNGMAHIVRSGQLTAPMSLTFHPEDMNDVLKSFTAWNPDTNELYSVGYTAGIPSSHLLSRFPFSVTGPDTGLGGFLLQVKGAEVKLDVGRTLEGRLVAVQQMDRTTAPQTSSTDHRLTVLLRDGSLQSAWLSEVRSVELVDPQLREQLRSYLEVLAAGRQDVTKDISVYPVPAPGPVQIAYLQQFPLWKTSYRVDLGAKEGRIQGWAQIDNPTGEPWENVTVSLVSGAPVSFVMNLYDPLYTARSTVAVPSAQVAAPRQYQSAVSTSTLSGQLGAQAEAARVAGVAGGAPGGGGGGARGGRGGAPPPAPAAPPPPPARAEATFRAGVDLADLNSAAFAAASATRVEDLYEYTFPFAVRIGSRESALLPFLQKTLPVEKLSIFNASLDRGNPRLGARLENTADIPFEAGPVTFYVDSRYAGEAVLDYLPRGERSLVSYGVDYEIQVASNQKSRPENTVRLTVSNGVAVLFMESVLTTTYEVRNKGLNQKTLIVEHPRAGNRTLQDAKPFETTENFHRFRLALNAQQATALNVPEVVARQTRLALTSLTRPQLALFSNRSAPAQVRERLGQIVDLQEQLAAMRTNVQAAQSAIDATFKDQDRLRENLKALGDRPEDQQLRSRYLGQLETQEDQLAAARERITAITAEVAATEATLGNLITTFTFEG